MRRGRKSAHATFQACCSQLTHESCYKNCSYRRHIPNITELWNEFGVGKNKRNIQIHALWITFVLSCYMSSMLLPILTLFEILAPLTADALPFFHSFTGCDMVSTFADIGKRTAWNACMYEISCRWWDIYLNCWQSSEFNLAQKESSYSKYSTNSWWAHTTYKTSSIANIHLEQVPRTCSFNNIANWMGFKVNTVWVWTSLDNNVRCFKPLRGISLLFLQEVMLDLQMCKTKSTMHTTMRLWRTLF